MVNLLSIFAITSTALRAVQAHARKPLGDLQRRELLQIRQQCGQIIACQLAREAEEGPYYIDHPLIRSDIRDNQPGVQLELKVTVMDTNTCKPASEVFVDIWHCNAAGVYSGWASKEYLSPLLHGQLRKKRGIPEDTTRWLRGVQLTDSNGQATFLTVFPGWYEGRTTHIHLRVHTGHNKVDDGVFLGANNTSHMGQIFFKDKLVLDVKDQLPYSKNTKRLLLNGKDDIYKKSHGGEQVVHIDKRGNGEHISFDGTITVGINPTARPTSPPRGPPGPPPPEHRQQQWSASSLLEKLAVGRGLRCSVVQLLGSINTGAPIAEGLRDCPK
jgi:protocatechuate 3,4-dioxygenase beta subunit